MDTQSLAEVDQADRAGAGLSAALCAFLLATGLLATLPAVAQPAHAMAWVFDGPGCRAQLTGTPSGASSAASIGATPSASHATTSSACADDALVKTLLEWLTTPHEPQGAARSPESLHLQPPRLAILDQAGLSARLCPAARARPLLPRP